MKKWIGLACAGVLAVTLCGCQAGDYYTALDLAQKGETEAAIALFLELGDYRDSLERAAALGGEAAVPAVTGPEEVEEPVEAPAQDGLWVTDALPISDAVLDGLSTEDFDARMLIEDNEAVMYFILEPKEDGTFRLALDKDTFQKTLKNLSITADRKMKELMNTEVERLAKENNMSVADFLTAMNVSSVEGMMESVLGKSQKEFINESLIQPLSTIADGIDFTGTYELDGSKCVLKVGDTTVSGDVDSQTISLRESSDPGFQSLLPMQFHPSK